MSWGTVIELLRSGIAVPPVLAQVAEGAALAELRNSLLPTEGRAWTRTCGIFAYLQSLFPCVREGRG